MNDEVEMLEELFNKITKQVERGIDLPDFSVPTHARFVGRLRRYEWLHFEFFEGQLFEEELLADPWLPLPGAVGDLREALGAEHIPDEVVLDHIRGKPQEMVGPREDILWRLQNAIEAMSLAAWNWPDPDDIPEWYHEAMGQLADDWWEDVGHRREEVGGWVERKNSDLLLRCDAWGEPFWGKIIWF